MTSPTYDSRWRRRPRPAGASATANEIRLNPAQINAFLRDRLDGTGPCEVSESLDWTALARTGVVPGARLLMEEMAGRGAKLTVTGNLSRKSVAGLMDQVPWDGVDLEMLRSISKVFNEGDFAPAEYLHALLRTAGLARKAREFLKLSVKGRGLVSEQDAGRLFALLFRTTFAGYNLAYLDRYPLPDPFQPQISFTLFVIGRFCMDWKLPSDLLPGATLPFGDLPPEVVRRLAGAFDARVLRYLCWFGLLEKAPLAPGQKSWDPRAVRKTPLYDRALSFRL